MRKRCGQLLVVLFGIVGCGSSGHAGAAAVRGGVDGGSGGGAAGGGSGAGGSDNTGPLAVTVSPKTAQPTFGGTVQFSARVAGTADKVVTWAVTEGASGGSVSPAGLYTAPSTAGRYHVVATSHFDSTKTDSATVAVTAPAGTPPTLEVGKWINVSPVVVPYGNVGTIDTLAVGIAMDPGSPYTLYECVSAYDNNGFAAIPQGVYKTTDGGSTWKKVGTMDSPIQVAVDPTDGKHLYAVDGVRGATQGFWVSTDGGDTWTEPQGFVDACKDKRIGHQDVYGIATDPTDFKHFVLSFHGDWSTSPNSSGVLESKDGGSTFTLHDPDPAMKGMGYYVMFLSNPALKLGDSNTWLLATQVSGLWKTTDAGGKWTLVTPNVIPHEGSHLYYTKDGTLYVAAQNHPLRSKDNGSTWTSLDGSPPGAYATIFGDGANLYIQPAGFQSGMSAFYTSAETDGNTWAPLNGGSQTFGSGPFQMTFDSAHNILYASIYNDGVWALKTQ